MRQLGLNDPLLDQPVEDMEIKGPVAHEVALSLSRVVLEGCDLGPELFG